MMEPRRLLEECPSDIERALLNAGATYSCSSNGRAKTLTALGLAGSAALSAGAVSMTATSLLAKIGWPKFLLALSAIGAITAIPVGYYVWHHHNTRLVAVADPGILSAAKEFEHTAAGNDPGPVSVPAVPAVAPAELDAKHFASPKVDAKEDAPTAALSDELNALDGARTMLASGNAAGALSHLDAYNRTFPRGRLQLEAEVLRIDALVKNGQTEIAKKRAQAFLAKHPNSVLASRVRGLL